MNIEDYGYIGQAAEDVARITAAHKERYEIVCARGAAYARLKAGIFYNGANVEYPTTGDFVRIMWNGSGDSLILETLPRRSFFARSEPGVARAQAVAANFDYVFALASLNRDFNVKRLERYLALAWQSGATPVVVLTKADLQCDYREQLSEAERIAPGVAVHAISARTGFGLEGLAKYFSARTTSVFLGSSGVGKSSLVNALAGEEIMAVNVTRDVDASKGRHTTTHRQLIMLANGSMIIDTPGMRELGMCAVSEGLERSFADVEAILERPCRFRDCKHEREPGCAVLAALESGELARERWESYVTLEREARRADRGIAARLEKQALYLAIAKKRKALNTERKSR